MNILNINKMCRVCLNINIHSTHKMLSILDEIISLKLKLCGGIIISETLNEEYPNLICEPCCKNMQIAYDFRTTCENSEITLKKLFLKTEKIKKHETNLQLLDKSISPADADFSDIKLLGTDIKEELLSNEDLDDSRCFEEETQHSGKILDTCLQKQEHLKTKNQIENKIIRKYVKKKALKTEVLKDAKAKRKYTKKSSIANVKLNNEEKYVCEFCHLEYKGKSSFTYHMRRHTNELNYVCEICGTAFETNFKLKRHFLKHMGTLPYSCRTCDMKFSSSSNRDRHERRLHTTIRPFRCSHCEKAFSYSDQLKNHIRVHTGEKPYVCEKCGSAFKRKSHLSAHSNALTPCVIKMTLKNKIVNEKTLSKISIKMNAVKNKNSKFAHKDPINTEDIRNTVKENLPMIQKINKPSTSYTSKENYCGSIETKQSGSNQCPNIDFQDPDQLNFYNINITEQNTFAKQDVTNKEQ